MRKNVPLLIGNLGPLTFGMDGNNEVILFEAAGADPAAARATSGRSRALIAEIAKRLPDTSLIR